MKRLLTIMSLAPAMAVVAMLPAPVAREIAADGGDAEIFRGRKGAYEIVIGITPESPTVGTVHLVVTPLDAQTSLPVSGASILVVANDPEGRPKYQVRAVTSPAFPGLYEANLAIDSPGLWTFHVEVGGSLGEVTFAVPVNVEGQAPASSAGGTAVWLGVLFALFGGSLYVWYSSRRQRAAQRAPKPR